ncbi:MAG: heparinase II/III family protein [Pseudomonadota bacterium]
MPFAMQLHGMGWLDDLMMLDRPDAEESGRRWTMEWIRQFGRGLGPGWWAPLVGRRLLRMISHAPRLLKGMPAGDQSLFFDSIYRQAILLRRHWRDAPEGLARMEALTGLLYAAIALEGMGNLRDRASALLTSAMDKDVGPDGGIASRNPEALLEVATLLGWAINALERSEGPIPAALLDAQARIIPTLRALRHADGSLARFHGGGRGRKGRLDMALIESGVRARDPAALSMGFAPLHHGRTTLIADAAAPPTGITSGSAHASTLAFELTSGSCPLIVNCGPGGAFGPEWHRAGRATASHSTLSLAGVSSARIGPLLARGGRRIAPLVQGPKRVQWRRSVSATSSVIMTSHDGYVRSHGLTHLRRLSLSTDGRSLEGEDSLRAVSAVDKERFEDVQSHVRPLGLPFDIRFHLHPDVEAVFDEVTGMVVMVLTNGEAWTFRPGHGVNIALEPSVHLEPGRLKPRATKQVVLSDRVVTYAATIDWTLSRIEVTPERPKVAADAV